MTEHTYIIKKKITDEQIDDIMSAALQGMTYWADDAKVPDPQYPEDRLFSKALTSNKEIAIHDSEDDKWYTLTLEKFLNGLAMEGGDPEDYDMYNAERVVQYAIFGKLIYG